MKFYAKTTNPESADVDLLFLFIYQDESIEKNTHLPSAILKNISTGAEKERFKGREGEELIIYTKGLISSYKLCMIGLGRESEFDLYQLRKSMAGAAKKGRRIKAKKIGIVVRDDWYAKFESSGVGQGTAEGLSLGGYKFLKYKSEEEREKVQNIEEVLVLVSPNKLAGLEKGITLGQIFSEATLYSRDLINEPPSKTTPSHLASEAMNIAKLSDGIVKASIYEKEEIKKLGMEAFLGVSRGSAEEPKLLILEYKPKGAKLFVALVGKGITFDTGGLSLKPAESMMTMKMDMSGGAAVLGIFKALVKLKPNIHMIGIVAACENMPSGSAIKPGDIVRAMNGKTIEILNTDAEGRVTLADALSYAASRKPNFIIDMATLTGACMVALGQEIAGMWGNDKKLIDKVDKAAHRVGEKVWLMPLEKEYKDLIKSDIADIKNIQTGRYGGAITAALFLEEFVDKVSWVHLDIAGPAFSEAETAIVPKGGAGFGVRTVLQFILDLDY